MGDVPPPPGEGLRRSKRNKYHLNVASLLLSSSSTIRRDVSPPSPVKTTSSQSQKRRGEKAKLCTPTNASNGTTTSASSTKSVATSTTVLEPKRGSTLTTTASSTLKRSPSMTLTRSSGSTMNGASMTSNTCSSNDAIKTLGNNSSSTSSTAVVLRVATMKEMNINSSTMKEIALNNGGALTSQMEGMKKSTNAMHMVVPLMTNTVEGMQQLKAVDIQLPEQILEEEDAPIDQCSTTEGGAGAQSTAAVTPADVGDSTQQLRLKRKRKIPLKHRDYFNGVEAEDSEEDDDLEEQLQQPKLVKIEYTMSPDNTKLDDHACPKCPAIFDSRVGLTNHLKLHGSDKEFPCELCDFSCTNKKTMRQHRRVHGLSRRSRNSHMFTTTSAATIFKGGGEFSGNTATVGVLKSPSNAFLGKVSSTSAAAAPLPQWTTKRQQYCVNLDKLAAQGHEMKVTTKTVFKPIIPSSTNVYTTNNKYCATVADVAKLVTQMHEQQMQKQRQRKAQEEKEKEEKRRRNKNGIIIRKGEGNKEEHDDDDDDGDDENGGRKKTTDEEDEEKQDGGGGDGDGMPILEQQQLDDDEDDDEEEEDDDVNDDDYRIPRKQRSTANSNKKKSGSCSSGGSTTNRVVIDGGSNAEHDGIIGESSNDRTGTSPVINVRKESSASSAGKGTVVYDRNTIQCPHCPFRTQSRQRLEPHLKGHTRTYGFQCSACGFKSDSSGFIRRHNQLHDEACKWPPDYVGVPNNERLLAKFLGGGPSRRPAPTHANGTEITVSSSSASPSSSWVDGCEESTQSTAAATSSADVQVQHQQHRQAEQEMVVVNNGNGNTIHRLIKMEMEEFNEDEHDQLDVLVMENTTRDNNNMDTNMTTTSVAPQLNAVGDGPTPPAAAEVNKFRWTRQHIVDRWRTYQKKCLQIRSPIEQCSSSSSSSSSFLPTSLPHHAFSLVCRRCQLQFHSSSAHLALHNARHHRIFGINRRALCRELLAERLAWRDDRGEGVELELTTLAAPNGGREDDHRIPSASAPDDDASRDNISSSANETATTTACVTAGPSSSCAAKVFRCRNCPFNTDQIFRLQKHENKHLVKSEHQCPHCSFSCRSLDILAQHKRLHHEHNEEQQQHNANENNNTSSSNRTPTTSECELPDNEQPKTMALLTAPSLAPSTVVTALKQLSSSSSTMTTTTRLAPIRRNEAHYCPHCPYSSKHNCDMKAHMRMHEVRSKFACSLCTYSTKRQNALIAHEQLHRQGPLLGSPAVLGPRGAKCRRLKRIILMLNGRPRNCFSTSLLIGERIRFDGACTHFYRCAHRQCREEMAFCADLARHARNHCTKGGSRLFQCNQCTFATNLDHRLQSHQLVTHSRYTNAGGTDESGEEKNSRTDAGIFNCKECPFFTVNYAKFWNHRQKHKRSNRFTCKHCSFSSGSVQCYAEHVAMHGGDTYSTNIINRELDAPHDAAMVNIIKQPPLLMTSAKSAPSLTGTLSSSSSVVTTTTTTKEASCNNNEDENHHQKMSSSKKKELTTTTTLMGTKNDGVVARQQYQQQKSDEGKESKLISTTLTTASSSQTAADCAGGGSAASLTTKIGTLDQFDAAVPFYMLTKSVLGFDVGHSADFSSDATTTATTSNSDTVSSKNTHCCAECPFETVHSVLLRLHMEMHWNGACRPFTCALCTFGCFSADSLHAHLALHASATTLEGGGGSGDNNNGCRRSRSNDGGTTTARTDPSSGTESAGPTMDVGSSSSMLYTCSQCSFKCVELEQFLNHRREHVQLIQQRLMTIIKRAAVMENINATSAVGGNGGAATKVDKMPKAYGSGGGRTTVDKQHYCTRCSFRCDSVQAFTRHWEHHRIDNCRPGIFQCSACDYSSDTRNVVLFHEHNHHLDIPLTSLCKNIELVKEHQQQ